MFSLLPKCFDLSQCYLSSQLSSRFVNGVSGAVEVPYLVPVCHYPLYLIMYLRMPNFNVGIPKSPQLLQLIGAVEPRYWV